jgi:beta-lactamase class A
MLARRGMLLGMGSLGLLAAAGRAVGSATAVSAADKALEDRLAALERASGLRMGFAVLDGLDGTIVGHRTGERFTMCSTFKLSLAAAILRQIDQGKIGGALTLPITPNDVVGHAPEVAAALARGETRMDVVALAKAAQIQSDNGAANILLRLLGGPAALTAFWRALGDTVSRLDRYEPALNTSHDGDPRDTTTPGAMAKTLNALLAGNGLSPQSRGTLIGWMEETQTGLKRLRAGLPKGWRVGDKTGTMDGAAYPDKASDIAIVWRPGRRAPFMLTGFVEGKLDRAETALAQAAVHAAQWMEGRGA